MNKEEYITEIAVDIISLLDDYKLNNYKKQIFAWRLNATFNRTYDVTYLWNRALFLSTNACILLQNDSNEKLAMNSLKECAEIYEYLSELPDISEKYDQQYLLLLASLCYDLAGYQANAYCTANKIINYKLISKNENIKLEPDNIIIEQIRYILLKKIPLANYMLKQYEVNGNIGLKLFIDSISKWYKFILNLEKQEYLLGLHQAYKYYLSIANTHTSHLLLMLETRLMLFDKRSIWKNLSKDELILTNSFWKKYVKLLAQDLYSSNNLKSVENRHSKFEFWTSQLRALENGLINVDENFVVQMPTSAGKTFIAELLILKHLINHPEKKCIYIAPFRALTAEKEIEIGQYFTKLGYSVSSLTGSYEIDAFQDVILNESDVLIATPEKIDLLLRTNPDFFNDISFITVDEGHIVGDISSRSSLLEFLIIRLRIKIPSIRTLFISAVMPPVNATEYSLWLSGKEKNVLRSLQFSDSNVYEEWEPTRKLISSLNWVGDNANINFQNVITEDETTRVNKGAIVYSYLKNKEFDNKIPLKNNKIQTTSSLAYKMALEGNTLVFCAQPRQTKWISDPLLSIIKSLPENEMPTWFKINTDKESYYYSNIWYGENFYITNAIKFGIGIHFGDMPEQVRNSVENDFRNGNLRILLSSNTVGQGLNFPIKNLIFYSIQLGQANYIDKRDFWNIIGRAGRAGKETEGKVIFIINTNIDRNLYNTFTNKANIEEANSFFYVILQAFLDGRINDITLNNYTSILSEPYLLDLITEEILETDFEDIVQKIIDNSLFKIQIDKRDIDIAPLKNSLKKIFINFKEHLSLDQINVYRKTGFSFNSNRIIDDFITLRLEELRTIIQNDEYLLIIEKFLELLNENIIEELKDSKLNRIVTKPSNYYVIIEKWIQGISIQELQIEWSRLDNNRENLNIFISKAFYYLYPWGLTTFLTILAYKLNISINELPEKIKNLSSFIKFGVNQSTACLACSLGIKSRQLSLLLYEESVFLTGKDFIRWLSNLSSEEIENYQISKFDKNNLHNVSLKLTPYHFRNVPNSFEFEIKGIYYEQSRRDISKRVVLGEVLDYERDKGNRIDPYAIMISKNNEMIGFIPKEYAKLITSEIDINETKYTIVVTEITEGDEYNKIRTEMKIIN